MYNHLYLRDKDIFQVLDTKLDLTPKEIIQMIKTDIILVSKLENLTLKGYENYLCQFLSVLTLFPNLTSLTIDFKFIAAPLKQKTLSLLSTSITANTTLLKLNI